MVGSLLAPVGQSQELVDRLRAGIAPAALAGWPQDKATVFTKRNIGGQTVDLGRGGEEHFFLLLVGGGEHDLGAVHVRLDGPHRAFDNQSHANRRRQVKDDVALVHQLGDRRP